MSHSLTSGQNNESYSPPENTNLYDLQPLQLGLRASLPRPRRARWALALWPGEPRKVLSGTIGYIASSFPGVASCCSVHN
jgi:hypothetical protein